MVNRSWKRLIISIPIRLNRFFHHKSKQSTRLNETWFKLEHMGTALVGKRLIPGRPDNHCFTNRGHLIR